MAIEYDWTLEMSQLTTVADSILELAALVKAGNRAQAKRQARALLDTADPRHLDVVTECATILDYWPRIGIAKLRAYWQSSTDPQHRAIIAACAPEPGEHPQRTQPATSRTARPATRSAPVHRQTRPELRRRPRPQPQESTEVRAYFRDRAGINDQPEHDERPDGYATDYDTTAVPALRGTPCVSCFIERTNADQARRPDDGLCGECRDKNRLGIPALPAGHTRADTITARCAFLATHNPPTAALYILRSEWERATQPRDRVTIAEWVKANQAVIDAPTPATVAVIGHTCRTCGNTRRVRDGECIDCRNLTPEPDPAGPAAQSVPSIAGPRLNSDRGRAAA